MTWFFVGPPFRGTHGDVVFAPDSPVTMVALGNKFGALRDGGDPLIFFQVVG